GLSALLFMGIASLPGSPMHSESALRDAAVLAAAGTMAARSAPHFFAGVFRDSIVSPRTVRIIELEQLAGVLCVLVVGALSRPGQGTVVWQLPGTAWLFVAFGVGAVMGFVIAALFRAVKGTQFTVALL